VAEPRKVVLVCKARGTEEEGGGPPKKAAESSEEASTLDYERSLVKSAQRPRKRVGKGVPQLGKVSKPVPPLIVTN